MSNTATQKKRVLAHGTLKAIADKTGVSIATVSRTVNGKSDNSIVIDEISKLLRQQERKKSKLQNIRSRLFIQTS